MEQFDTDIKEKLFIDYLYLMKNIFESELG